MWNKIILTFVFISTASYGSAQKKVELTSDNNVIISYLVSKKDIKFYIKTNGGSPDIRIDVNKNGVIDNMVDRSYGITNGSFAICKQYLIDERTSTHCAGAPSHAKLSGERFNYVFTIPFKELITPIDPEKVHVQFQLSINENGGWKYYRYPYSHGMFGDVYKIKIK